MGAMLKAKLCYHQASYFIFSQPGIIEIKLESLLS
jgi:hypothetical protein